MKRKKKRHLVFVIYFLAFVFCSLGNAACGNDNDDSSSDSDTDIDTDNDTDTDTDTDTDPDTWFITSWKTDNEGGSGSNEIKLPLVPAGEYNFYIDWGDGTQNAISTWDDVAKTHLPY